MVSKMKPSDATPGAIQVFSPGELVPFPDVKLANFTTELRAAREHAMSARQFNRCRSIVAFGYPGNGRRTFARTLANDLFREGFHVVAVDVPAICAFDRSRLQTSVNGLRTILTDKQTRPLLLLVERLDSLISSSRERPALADLQSSFSRRFPCPLVVLATATSPALATTILGTEVSFVFCDWPDEEAEARLLEQEGFGNEAGLIQSLSRVAREEKVRYTMTGLVDGIREVRRLYPNLDRLRAMPPDERLETALAFLGSTLDDEASAYKRQYAPFIERARQLAGSREDDERLAR
jgi:hypothetical protein